MAARALAMFVFLFLARAAFSLTWGGVVLSSQGRAVRSAQVSLSSEDGKDQYSARTSSTGAFSFSQLLPGDYELVVISDGIAYKDQNLLHLGNSTDLAVQLRLVSEDETRRILVTDSTAGGSGTGASGGEHLSSTEVSGLPLNSRDFSKLLLLAAGTMTDTNGAANFTQQFAVNGQRGTATVFAMDGFDTTDPEMGGATFSNFNVDAIQEVQSNAGVMQAEIGHGGASFTNVLTKSGVNQIHGSLFEFVRNAAFDARNYFDYRDPTGKRRIPPFVRNEFGFTNGGPVVLPGIYNGRDRTFYFGEYQGFRQVLGTTQVIPVPTADERKGIDTTTYPGDTLSVPISTQIAPVLNGYPLPNEPNGPLKDRTYAASSKVVTRTDQFSIRVDQKISEKASLLSRFSLNQVTGPLTNPDQTVINPDFGIQFFDHQRNAGVRYTRIISSHVTSDTSLGYIRSTPFFPATNHTLPGIAYADGLYQPYNQLSGSVFGSYSNLYQFKQDFAWVHKSHDLMWGTEIRINRDSTIFGVNPNGIYEFGGGKVYSPVEIKSASGAHDVHVGNPLPDSLTALLTATPYSYNIMGAADITPVGAKFNEAGVRREAYNFYFQDTWKATPHLTVSYGLRYELNTRIHEATKRTSLPIFTGPDGKTVPYWDRNAHQEVFINPQPPYDLDVNGWGPRLALDYAVAKQTVLHAGASIATGLPNLWQDNFLTAGIPYVFAPSIYAQPNEPVTFHNTFVPLNLPTA